MRNWAGNVEFQAARLHEPQSLDELRRIVAGAEHVRALGAGHSFSRLGDTTHELVRLGAMAPLCEIDHEASTVRLAAGLRYSDFIARLDASGHALANLASLPHITVAGSCATGTHGSGDGQPVLSAAVRSLCLVGAEGDLLTLSHDDNPETFPGAVVALGALGVVAELTLELVPAFEIAQRLWVEVPLDAVAENIDGVFGAAYSVSAFTDWGSGLATLWFKSMAGDPPPACVGGRPAEHQMHPCAGMSGASCSQQLGVPGPWHERLPHFRPGLTPSIGDELQSEYLLPRVDAPAAFAALADIGEQIAPVLHIAEIRSIRRDDMWLSGAYGRDSIGFHFTWRNDSARVQPVMEAVEGRLLALGARPHWAKLTSAAPADVIARYPRAGDFDRLAGRLDPAGKFRNPLVESLFPR